ncbi:GNAT family N-acetyltransferase [Nocardia niwae]|uniref:GNAT family N-acetyltransferase n=1 Tax=Nocardia niwae TaxID=626084 RepID=A0ABV2X7Q8_9NOCA|nr:GNAT family N-acetyltransferase [Nocardia niwae]
MNIAKAPQPEYRRACFADLDDIAAIEAEVFAEPYLYLMLRQLFDLHGSEWLVAELDGTVIGYALTLEKKGRALLFTFAVAKRHQGGGYGRGLLSRTLQTCRKVGAEVVYLTVRPDNQHASNLFKRAGFEFVEHDDRYFGPGEPRDVFEYRLKGRPLDS